MQRNIKQPCWFHENTPFNLYLVFATADTIVTLLQFRLEALLVAGCPRLALLRRYPAFDLMLDQ